MVAVLAITAAANTFGQFTCDFWRLNFSAGKYNIAEPEPALTVYEGCLQEKTLSGGDPHENVQIFDLCFDCFDFVLFGTGGFFGWRLQPADIFSV